MMESFDLSVAISLEAIDIQYFNLYMLRHQFYVDQIESLYFSRYVDRPLDAWDLQSIKNWESLEGCWGGGEQLQHEIRRSSEDASLELVCMEQFYSSPRSVEFVFFTSAGGLPMIIHRYLDSHERVFTVDDRSWGALSFVNRVVVDSEDGGRTFQVEVSTPMGEVECWRFEFLDGGFSLSTSFRAVHFSSDANSAWSSTLCPPPYAEERDNCSPDVSPLHTFPSYEAARAASISGFASIGGVQSVVHKYNLTLLVGDGLCARSRSVSDRGSWQLEGTSPFSSAALWASAALLACVALVVLRCLKNRCRSADSSDSIQADVFGAAQDGQSELTSKETSSTSEEFHAAQRPAEAAAGGDEGPSNNSGEAFRKVDFAEIKRLGTREHWYIEAGDLTFKRQIASGAFGCVHEAYLHVHTPVAVKVPRSCSRSTLQTFAAEIQILRRLRHPNIVLMQGVSVMSAADICIVLEWVPGQTLENLVRLFRGNVAAQTQVSSSSSHQPAPSSMEEPRLTAECLPKVVVDAARGLQYIHAQKPPILHRDLKPANVLVNTAVKPPEGKVADLGLSAIMKSDTLMSRIGTPRYMAPEVAQGRSYGVAADTYSFGLIISFAKPDPQIPYEELGAWCCSTEPEKRPDMAKVLSKMIQLLDELDLGSESL